MRNKKSGFTLIELLIVIAIIAIIAGIVFVALNPLQRFASARDTIRLSQVTQIKKALDLYLLDNGQYPTASQWASSSLVSPSGAVYLGTIPIAPTPADGSCSSSSNAYVYTPSTPSNSYTLSFCLGSNVSTVLAGNNILTPAGISGAASSSGGNPQSVTLNYTGSIVTWTVPAGVSSITVTAKGASGGYSAGGTAGKGATMIGTFTVSPANVLSILVGQSPGSISNGTAGGGGGTFVALGSSYISATPLIVAGGGGGGYWTGTGIGAPITTSGTGSNAGTGGNGAPTDQCGGGGGGFYTSGANDTLDSNGFGGKGFRQGGAGGAGGGNQAGGFGGGSTGDSLDSCSTWGGAGGGYSGGGAGASFYLGNAGGSYNSGTSQNNTAGSNSGNGVVIINYTN